VRVLQVLTLAGESGEYGGPLAVALNQLRALSGRGHEVRLASTFRQRKGDPVRREEKVAGVQMTLFAASALPGLGVSGLHSGALTAWLWTTVCNASVVHVHAARDLVPLSAMAVCGFRGRPYVTQTHGMILPSQSPAKRAVDALGARGLLRGAAVNLALHEREREELVAVGCRAERVEVLPNGVPVAMARWARRDGGAPEVLFLARLQARKRPVAFVEMAALLVARGIDARFTLVGPDGGELAAVRQRIEELGLLGRVSYEGALAPDKVPTRLAAASVYVLPSTDEPYPMSLLEALSVGVPSVCTDTCQIATELRAADAVAVSRPDTESLSQVVEHLLRNPDLASGLGARGRFHAEHAFGMAEVAARLEGVYARALALEGRLQHA
jgi:glycosyltransferase involved in cell wall biosynthesis